MDNSISVVGNVTRDPVLHFTNGGAPQLRLNVVVNRRWFNRDTKSMEERPSYFEVTAFHDLAKNASESLLRGDRVIVMGKLSQRHFTAEDGNKISIVEVLADHIGVDLRSQAVEIVEPD